MITGMTKKVMMNEVAMARNMAVIQRYLTRKGKSILLLDLFFYLQIPLHHLPETFFGGILWLEAIIKDF